jgi:hypothetical protein
LLALARIVPPGPVRRRIACVRVSFVCRGDGEDAFTIAVGADYSRSRRDGTTHACARFAASAHGIRIARRADVAPKRRSRRAFTMHPHMRRRESRHVFRFAFAFH